MDFLLECIGFPPDYPLEELLVRARKSGDQVLWRGEAGNHLRLPLGQGIEVRFDREREALSWSIAPYFDTPHRLRVAVSSIEKSPDSPFDCLLRGWVDPPVDADEHARSATMLAALLWDARRLPSQIPEGHVLAVSIAAFALNVDFVGPNACGREPSVLEHPHGAWIEPLGGKMDPGGCVEASLRIRAVKRVENPITRCPVDVLEADAPGRPLPVLVSHWQLRRDGLPTPRPGWRIEGVFLLSGRLVGGLPSSATRLGRDFG